MVGWKQELREVVATAMQRKANGASKKEDVG